MAEQDPAQQVDPNEPEAIRSLREANRRNEEKARAGEAATRKLAFYEAGIDMSNPTAELLFKAYDGELDTDQIKAEAAKYGLLGEGQAPQPTPQAPAPPAHDPAQTAQRTLITQETHDPAAPVDEGNPMDKAYATFRADQRAGSTAAEASGAVFGAMFQAAREGKPGFVFDSEEWQGSDAARLALMRTHEGPHGGANHDEACFGCRIKAKGFVLSSSATPSRQRPSKMRPITQPSWEAGVTGEHRPDGSFMPYLDKTLEPIGVKQMADNRHVYEEVRHRQLNDPNFGRQ